MPSSSHHPATKQHTSPTTTTPPLPVTRGPSMDDSEEGSNGNDHQQEYVDYEQLNAYQILGIPITVCTVLDLLPSLLRIPPIYWQRLRLLM